MEVKVDDFFDYELVVHYKRVLNKEDQKYVSERFESMKDDMFEIIEEYMEFFEELKISRRDMFSRIYSLWDFLEDKLATIQSYIEELCILMLMQV